MYLKDLFNNVFYKPGGINGTIFQWGKTSWSHSVNLYTVTVRSYQSIIFTYDVNWGMKIRTEDWDHISALLVAPRIQHDQNLAISTLHRSQVYKTALLYSTEQCNPLTSILQQHWATEALKLSGRLIFRLYKLQVTILIIVKGRSCTSTLIVLTDNTAYNSQLAMPIFNMTYATVQLQTFPTRGRSTSHLIPSRHLFNRKITF